MLPQAAVHGLLLVEALGGRLGGRIGGPLGARLASAADPSAPATSPPASPVDAPVDAPVEAAKDAVTSGVAVILAIAAALVVALLLAEVGAALTRALGRRSRTAEGLARRARLPLRTLLAVVLVWIGLRLATPDGSGRPSWLGPVEHTLLIGTILSGAWLVGVLAFVLEDATLARWKIGAGGDRYARRLRTQISVLRRMTAVVLAVVAVGASLLTFEGARQWGAGLLASAGLVSVVVGFAAQSSLSNLFAGLQLAFTDAIRLDDVVVVEGYWGRIEEITLTYVVVHVWDDRRLIVPSTYFTSRPFENWTRRAADLLGTVELDVDWAVPVARMRAELARILQASELWDHRVGVLQVTDAVDGHVRVRALASATDAPTLFDLRCQVREGLVAWLQREHPEALPRTRWEVDGGGAGGGPGAAAAGGGAGAGAGAATGERGPAWRDAPAGRPGTQPLPVLPEADETALVGLGREQGLFTGSIQAVERSKAFAGPGEDVIAEREHHAEGLRRPEDRADGEHRRRSEGRSERRSDGRSEGAADGEPRHRPQDEPRSPVRERPVD